MDGFLWQEIALYSGIVAWGAMHIALERLHQKRRRALDELQADLTAEHGRLKAMKAEIDDGLDRMKDRMNACNEFAALWSYGAHEEAVAVLKAVEGIDVKERGA